MGLVVGYSGLAACYLDSCSWVKTYEGVLGEFLGPFDRFKKENIFIFGLKF